MKRNSTIRHALTFDDVLIVPAETAIKPADVQTHTQLTRNISLHLPLIAAPCAHVTESAMAIALAELGGIGVIHRHMPLGKQVEEVRRVKRRQAHVVTTPITISPDASLAEAVDLMGTYHVSALPVIDQSSRAVVGIITRRDINFVEDAGQPVSTLMTRDVVTAKPGISHDVARQIMHKHRIEKLVVVDEQGRCAGLLALKDMDRIARTPKATVDAQGRLRVAAAIGTGKEALDRAIAMADAGLDVVFVDVAHAHTREAAATISQIRQQRATEIQVVAGNVATAEAARSLIDAGADAIKVGIGAEPHASTRRLSGVGMPQLQALLDVADACDMQDIPVLADGGLITAERCAKALAAGARVLVLDTLFAGAEESPGHVVYHDGRLYRTLTPKAPNIAGLADALRLDEADNDTSTPYTGPVAHMVAGLMTGIVTAMAYAGGKDIAQFRSNAEFVRVSA